MKMNYNNLVDNLVACSKELSLLITEAKFRTKQHDIPNSKLEILKDRIKTIKENIDEVFDIIEEYEDIQ